LNEGGSPWASNKLAAAAAIIAAVAPLFEGLDMPFYLSVLSTR
jgi:hypothetical protein